MNKIVIDTREKNPWVFPGFEKTSQKLDTGDYSIEGFEDLICIERKKSTAELANNIGKDWKRFKRELERMRDIPLSFLICEFPIEYVYSFPENSGIPKKKLEYIRITSNFLASRLGKLETDYGIKILYADDSVDAEIIAHNIFNDVLDSYIVGGAPISKLQEKYKIEEEW